MTGDTSPQAFPISVQPDFQYSESGMSLLDYFAGQALAGLCANPDVDSLNVHYLASRAYEIASTMIMERIR